MEMKRFWQECAAFARRFVVIYGFTMLATLVFMALFSRDAYVNWQYFLWCVLFSLAADLPSLVFVSARELTEAAWRRRFVLSTLPAGANTVFPAVGTARSLWYLSVRETDVPRVRHYLHTERDY